MSTTHQSDILKLIAFYLPQFHAIPENDTWWGEGFTEWTNAKKAKPLFPGHQQPHVPHQDIGYYDLSDVAVSAKQAKLAQEYGVYGFCYYYYWFDGKKLLDKPLENVLNNPQIDMPFCICWANENWTRTWSGAERQILMPQTHAPEHDKEFIEDAIRLFKDERYITIDSKPVLVIYRTSLFPDIKKTAQMWREAVKKAGFNDLYLVRVEGLEPAIDPIEIGFDAAVQFAPDWRLSIMPDYDNKELVREYANQKYGVNRKLPIVRDYDLVLNRMVSEPTKTYKYFRGAFPCWDNTARKGNRGTVFIGSNPEKFMYFLRRQIANALEDKSLGADEKIVFLNAWNEWGEGCHLEPDEANGYKHLEAVKNALSNPSYDGSLEKGYTWQYVNDSIEYFAQSESQTGRLKEKTNEADNLREKIDEVLKQNEAINRQLTAIFESKSWRVLRRLRRMADPVYRIVRKK